MHRSKSVFAQWLYSKQSSNNTSSPWSYSSNFLRSYTLFELSNHRGSSMHQIMARKPPKRAGSIISHCWIWSKHLITFHAEWFLAFTAEKWSTGGASQVGQIAVHECQGLCPYSCWNITAVPHHCCVHQGSALSPPLFIRVVDVVMRDLRQPASWTLLYAGLKW